jgi:hypothetical protein
MCIITHDVRRLRDFYYAVLQVDAEGEDVFVAFPRAGAEVSIFSVQGIEAMTSGALHIAGTGS